MDDHTSIDYPECPSCGHEFMEPEAGRWVCPKCGMVKIMRVGFRY